MSEKNRGMRTRLMDVDEIVSRFKFSDRHARRLRSESDPRCFVTEEVYDPQKPDILFPLRAAFASMNTARIRFLELEERESEYALPENWQDIKAAFEAIDGAVDRARETVGYYHWREPDGLPNSPDGLPTIYDRALRGKTVHVAFKEILEAWAAKYSHKLDPKIYWGETEEDDETQDDTPAEPVNSGATEQSSTVGG